MVINNNTDFAMADPRYLRVKGFGLAEQPNNNEEPLRFQPRKLRMADLLTADCGDSLGNDDKYRLCTTRDRKCGPCFGDTGAPLYDVDKSGKASVLVGIVSFGDWASTNYFDPICTGERPLIYTAVARYVDWIRDTIARNEEGNDLEQPTFLAIPETGITDTVLAKKESTLAIFARTSIIVISSLVLIGIIAAILFSCTVRWLRRKRKRHMDGLAAEESFVNAGKKDSITIDPFEGIQEEQPRFSLTGLSRAAVKGATEFSSRSIGAIRAMLANEPTIDDFEPRDFLDGEPIWLSSAWAGLFKAPSKAELMKIHKIPTQRVVEDVLEGGDKSVEPSLQEIEFKAARDEANLEAAWAKLEVKTSMRNLADVVRSPSKCAQSPTASPVPRSPGQRTPISSSSLSPSPRRGSKSNLARAFSPRVSGKRKGGPELQKTDTLLAAFAYIDAESEQVAEETVIDSAALREFAEAKRPNLLAALRNKLSGHGSSKSYHGDREINGEVLHNSGRAGSTKKRGIPSPLSSGPLLGVASSRSSAISNGLLPASGKASRVPTNLSSSLSGLIGKNSLGSRHSSMVMDYFSEDYSLSDSSSDEGSETRNDFFAASSRRFTGDRPSESDEEEKPLDKSRSMRTGQVRSFESFEQLQSSKSLRRTTSVEEEIITELELPPVALDDVEMGDSFFADMDPAYSSSESGKSGATSDEDRYHGSSMPIHRRSTSIDSMEIQDQRETSKCYEALDKISVLMEQTSLTNRDAALNVASRHADAQAVGRTDDKISVHMERPVPAPKEPEKTLNVAPSKKKNSSPGDFHVSVEMEDAGFYTGHDRKEPGKVALDVDGMISDDANNAISVHMEGEAPHRAFRLLERETKSLSRGRSSRNTSSGHQSRPSSYPMIGATSGTLNLASPSFHDIEAQLDQDASPGHTGDGKDQVSVQTLKRMWSRIAGRKSSTNDLH